MFPRISRNSNGIFSGILLSKWYNYSILKNMSRLRENRTNVLTCTYGLTISDFSSYLENNKRYLKDSNGICSGILLSRWHNILIMKNISCFAGNRTFILTYRLTISDFPSYLENCIRYQKKSNVVCSGILLYRWNDSLILKKKTCLVLR